MPRPSLKTLVEDIKVLENVESMFQQAAAGFLAMPPSILSEIDDGVFDRQKYKAYNAGNPYQSCPAASQCNQLEMMLAKLSPEAKQRLCSGCSLRVLINEWKAMMHATVWRYHTHSHSSEAQFKGYFEEQSTANHPVCSFGSSPQPPEQRQTAPLPAFGLVAASFSPAELASADSSIPILPKHPVATKTILQDLQILDKLRSWRTCPGWVGMNADNVPDVLKKSTQLSKCHDTLQELLEAASSDGSLENFTQGPMAKLCPPETMQCAHRHSAAYFTKTLADQLGSLSPAAANALDALKNFSLVEESWMAELARRNIGGALAHCCIGISSK